MMIMMMIFVMIVMIVIIAMVMKIIMNMMMVVSMNKQTCTGHATQSNYNHHLDFSEKPQFVENGQKCELNCIHL